MVFLTDLLRKAFCGCAPLGLHSRVLALVSGSNTEPRRVRRDCFLKQVLVSPQSFQILLAQLNPVAFLLLCQNSGHEFQTHF